MPAAAAKIWTEKELLALPKDDGKYELVNGELSIMSPAGGEHGRVCLRLGARLLTFCDAHGLGGVYDGQTGYWMKSGNLRSPDISFVSKKNLKKLGGSPVGFFSIAPDLAIEVLSPSEPMTETNGKIADYFETGTRLVWVINPRSKASRVFHKPGKSILLSPDETLDGEDIVPGFSVPIREILDNV